MRLTLEGGLFTPVDEELACASVVLVPGGFTRPSSILTRRMLVGSSLTSVTGTGSRHSGQRRSLLVFKIVARHLTQNVCWHGSIRLLASSLSKQTEHSKRSKIDSMVTGPTRCEAFPLSIPDFVDTRTAVGLLPLLNYYLPVKAKQDYS